jgi:hypothetical protein
MKTTPRKATLNALLLLGAMLARAQAALPKATASVILTCTPPTNSTDPVAGYEFFRAPSGSTSYAQLNSKPTTSCAYTDLTAPADVTLDYIAESVDASGVPSTPSNLASATVLASLAAGTLTGKTN